MRVLIISTLLLLISCGKKEEETRGKHVGVSLELDSICFVLEAKEGSSMTELNGTVITAVPCDQVEL